MSGMRHARPGLQGRIHERYLQGGAMGLVLCVGPAGDGTVVSVSGDVDICTVTALEDVLRRTMRERSPRLLLDLSEVSFMDCAGLRAIVMIRRHAQLRGGSVRLIAVSAAVRRIVDLAGARDLFPVHDPVSLALAPGRGERVRLGVPRSVRPQFFLGRTDPDPTTGGCGSLRRRPG